MIFQRLAFNLGNETVFISQEEILYCKIDESYTAIYLNDGNSVLTGKSLKELEKILTPVLFVRIHNSSIINTQFEESYLTENDITVRMKNGTILGVSRRRKQEFLSRFLKL